MNRRPTALGLRPGCNAFGDVIDAGQLSRTERIDLLRRQAGRLLADGNREARWLGERLQTWLADGGELDAVLGVRAPRGSRATPQDRVRRDEVDGLLLRLSVQVGSDCKALEMLRGECPVASHVVDILDRLKVLNAPTSRDALTRARRRAAPHSQ